MFVVVLRTGVVGRLVEAPAVLGRLMAALGRAVIAVLGRLVAALGVVAAWETGLLVGRLDMLVGLVSRRVCPTRSGVSCHRVGAESEAENCELDLAVCMADQL